MNFNFLVRQIATATTLNSTARKTETAKRTITITPTLTVGHRGNSDDYPENTMLAVKKNVRHGANGIEIDVKRTSDGYFVLSHDGTLDRCTDGTGTITAVTWEYIQTLDAGSWKSVDFTGLEDCKVPLLSTVLDYLQGKDIFIFLHFYLQGAQLEAFVKLVTDRNMENQCIFFAQTVIIEELKTTHPTLITCANPEGDYAEHIANAVNYDVIRIYADEADLAGLIEDTHNAGKIAMVGPIGSDYATAVQNAIDLGADAFLVGDVTATLNVVKANLGHIQVRP